MLEREPYGSGWQVTLRAAGFVRWFPAAFLMFWLCGWAVGEYFAGGMLLALVGHVLGQSAWTTWLPIMKSVPPEPPIQLAFFVFITFWLTFWTWGGYTALTQLLGLICGREEIRIENDMLEVRMIAVFPVRRVRLEASRIRAFQSTRLSLMADTRGKRVSVASLGSVEERAELMQMLTEWHRTYARSVSEPPDAAPVPGWRVVPDESGAASLETDMGFQRGFGLVLLAIGVGAAWAGFQIGGHGDSPGRWGGMAVAGLFSLLFGYAGMWLTFVRESWHPRAGTIELRRHAFGQVWSTTFAPLTLQVVADTDSDGDSRWSLELRGEGQFRRLHTSTHDPDPPRDLGEWLARATGVPLTEKGQPSLFDRAS